MSDSVDSLVVVLKDDFSVEGIRPLMKAIEQMRGVVRVTPNIVDGSSFVAEHRMQVENLELFYTLARLVSTQGLTKVIDKLKQLEE